MRKDIDWLLFDADHTLYDFDRSSKIALELTMQSYEMDVENHSYDLYARINRQQWDAFERGQIDRHTLMHSRFSKYFEAIGVQLPDIAAFNLSYLTELPLHPFLFDGARELIDRVSQNYRIGIITNGAKEVQRPRLHGSAMHDKFDIIVVSGEIGMAKPNHDFFQHTYDLMDAPDKHRVLVIGDSLNSDIKGGNNFGFQTCWFNPERYQADPSIMPNVIVHSINEMDRMLR